MTGQTTSTTAVTEEERFDMANALEARFDRIDARFEAVELRFEMMELRFEKRLAEMQASILRWNVATMLTLVSVVAIITLTLR